MTLNTGCMPNTDFKYEEFEGLLGSYHLTLFCLSESLNEDDKEAYEKALKILNGFAERHGVQIPEEACKNPRAQTDWGKPRYFNSCSTLVDMLNSFWRDFGVAASNGKDYWERRELAWTILEVLIRKGVITEAKYNQHPSEDRMVPVEILNRDWMKMLQPLDDFIIKVP